MPEKPVGKVEHYYPKVQAAAVRLTKKVKVGDKVHIVGHGDDFTEKVTSLQLDHKPIDEGQPGQSVGLWVKDRVHEGDDVLLVTPGPEWSKPKAAKAKAKPKSKARPKAKKAYKSPKRKSATRRAKPARRAKGKGRKPAGKRRKATKRKSSRKKR